MERDFSEVPKEGRCWLLLPSELPQWLLVGAEKEHQSQQGRRDLQQMWWVVGVGGRGYT